MVFTVAIFGLKTWKERFVKGKAKGTKRKRPKRDSPFAQILNPKKKQKKKQKKKTTETFGHCLHPFAIHQRTF